MIGSLEEALQFARSVDGDVVPILVVDWTGVQRYFDREGLWAESALERWLSDTPEPAAVLAPLLEARYLSPAARALLGESFVPAARSLPDLSAPALREFRGNGGSTTLEPAEGGPLALTRLVRPTAAFPCAVTVLRVAEGSAARRELRQSEARYRGIVEDQIDFIVRYRPDGVRTFVNRPYAAFFGGRPEDFVGTSFLPLVASEHRAAVEEKIRRLTSREADVLAEEHLSIRHDGIPCWTHWVDRAIFDEDGKLVELQAVGRDITEQKEAERQRLLMEQRLGQAQKMEALGTLAGGLAHDFNNSLFCILGYADLVRSSAGDAQQVREHAESIRQATEKASELTRRLLQLSRRSPYRLAHCDVRQIVESAGRLLRASIPGRIAVRVTSEAVPPVVADAGQLTQALINLGLNARDAILAQGTIEITAAVDREGERDVVVIKVRDDGLGIPEGVRTRMFEPFFTTKAEGKGTGLGLAMVYACARAHDGRVEVSTELGRGTAVELRLPLKTVPPEGAGPEQASTGRETILLVEDDPLALLQCRQFLEDGGYQVLTASGGHEAIARFGDRLGELDAVVTDLVMPAGTGRELRQYLAAGRPSLPVLLMTGGLVDGRAGEFTAVLEKPFSADELLRSVRAILAQASRV